MDLTFNYQDKGWQKVRSGYQRGGITDVQQDAQVAELSFTELRSRLPSSINDDVVTVLAASKAALTDFANIRDQQDVDQFNQGTT